MKNILVLFIGLFISLNICSAQFDEVFVAANQTYLTGSKGNYQIRRPDSKVGFQIGAVIDFKSEKYNVLGPRNIEVSYLYTQGEIYGGFTAGGGHMISDFSYSRHQAMISTLLAEGSLSFVTIGFGLWTKASFYNKLTGTYSFSNPKDFGDGNINELSNTVNYLNLGLNLSLKADVYKSPTYSLAFFYNVSRSFFNEFDIAVSTIFMQHTFGIRYRILNDLKSNTTL